MWTFVWCLCRVAVHCVLPLYQLHKACGRTFGVCVVLPYTVFYRYTSYIKRVDVRLVCVSWCCTLCSTVMPVTLRVWTYVWWVFRVPVHCVLPLYQLHKACGRTFGVCVVMLYTVFSRYTCYIKRVDVRLVCVSCCRTLCSPVMPVT